MPVCMVRSCGGILSFTDKYACQSVLGVVVAYYLSLTNMHASLYGFGVVVAYYLPLTLEEEGVEGGGTCDPYKEFKSNIKIPLNCLLWKPGSSLVSIKLAV